MNASTKASICCNQENEDFHSINLLAKALYPFGFSVEETKRMTGETMVILTGEFESGDNKTPNRALSEEGLQTLAREIKALTMSMLLSEEENQTASDISLGEP
ncbi:hypothetical protein YC2023_095891 [Brassica napus]